jgi:hypothetical protein
MKPVKNKPQDQESYLKTLLNEFTKLQISSKDKLDKIGDLMNRGSSKDWDEKKKKKMQKRLEQADRDYRQTFEFIDQIKRQLDSIER